LLKLAEGGELEDADLETIARKWDYMDAQMRAQMRANMGDVWVEELLRARNDEERAAVLRVWQRIHGQAAGGAAHESAR